MSSTLMRGATHAGRAAGMPRRRARAHGALAKATRHACVAAALVHTLFLAGVAAAAGGGVSTLAPAAVACRRGCDACAAPASGAGGGGKSAKVKVAALTFEYTGHNCVGGEGACNSQAARYTSVAGMDPQGKQDVKVKVRPALAAETACVRNDACPCIACAGSSGVPVCARAVGARTCTCT